MAKHLTRHARRLRVTSTAAEAKLWQRLRNRQLDGLKFRRQVPLAGAIVDLYCAEARLAVELDGGGHNFPAAEARDQRRTERLASAGVVVLRFWNNDVLSRTEDVVEEIWRRARERIGGKGT